MKFTSVIFALVASASMAIAAPAENNNQAAQWTCPNGWKYCGECNGTSCKIAGYNYDCNDSTSCVGTGGGDGTICGSDGFGPQVCPVSK
ncbi:hypothetical protein BDV10DRAFT_182290 [Aspergillus recurvatus]